MPFGNHDGGSPELAAWRLKCILLPEHCMMTASVSMELLNGLTYGYGSDSL